MSKEYPKQQQLPVLGAPQLARRKVNNIVMFSTLLLLLFAPLLVGFGRRRAELLTMRNRHTHPGTEVLDLEGRVGIQERALQRHRLYADPLMEKRSRRGGGSSRIITEKEGLLQRTQCVMPFWVGKCAFAQCFSGVEIRTEKLIMLIDASCIQQEEEEEECSWNEERIRQTAAAMRALCHKPHLRHQRKMVKNK